MFALSGRRVFRCTSAGDSPSADGGNVPRPAAGAKRKGHLRFPFLFELLPFPCLLVWRKSETGDRFETGERQRIFPTVGEHSVLPFLYLFAVPDSLLLHRRFTLRRRDIAVSRSSLARRNRRHLRIKSYCAIYRVGRGALTPPFLTICCYLYTVRRSFQYEKIVIY